MHNRAVLIDPTGPVIWKYDKAHPAPGADPSIPGNGNIPVVDTPYGRLATVICLDAFYPTLMHQTGNKGIDIMIVPSQEWDDSAGESMTWVTQATTLRAIEYGYSLVRQASGDVAMTVDDQGHVLAASDYHMLDQQTMVAYVPVKGTWTIYGLIGDLFTWLCIAGLFALTLLVTFCSVRRSPDPRMPIPEQSTGNADEELGRETANQSGFVRQGSQGISKLCPDFLSIAESLGEVTSFEG
ncbi:MAG TPA: nitrilase-related carbon-nitrogen hydrolase [Ktedonobacteraceae bacterium]|jgi:apolipoprotein N-acyltransferase